MLRIFVFSFHTTISVDYNFNQLLPKPTKAERKVSYSHIEIRIVKIFL